MILSLLYPNLKYGQIKFHQDHIHPATLFTNHKLETYNIPIEKRELWKDIKDRLPNLQLMEGLENISKNKTLFKDWVNSTDNVKDIVKYKEDNYIDINISEEFYNFEEFYNKRREILRQKLINLL